MKKTILIALLLFATIYVNGQDAPLIEVQLFKNAFEPIMRSAYSYSFNYNGNTISNYYGPWFLCHKGGLVDKDFKTYYDDMHFGIMYDEQPIGSADVDKVHISLKFEKVNWDLMEPIVESHPNYLPEDLVCLTVRFPILMDVYEKRGWNEEFKKQPSSKEFILYVHKTRAEAMKKALKAISEYAKKRLGN